MKNFLFVSLAVIVACSDETDKVVDDEIAEEVNDETDKVVDDEIVEEVNDEIGKDINDEIAEEVNDETEKNVDDVIDIDPYDDSPNNKGKSKREDEGKFEIGEDLDENWANFKEQYDKHYKDADEEAYRRKIFEKAVEEVNEFNAGNHDWTKAIYKWGDLTSEEFDGLYTGSEE